MIRGSVDKLIELEEMKEDGRWDLLSKKEQSKLEKVYRKLSKNLGGIKTMQGLPGAMVVIDSTKEDIAISEARKLGIPIVAIVDTNGDPENIDYPIPGNDDAVRAIELFTAKITEAILEGKKSRMEKELLEAKQVEEAALEEARAADAAAAEAFTEPAEEAPVESKPEVTKKAPEPPAEVNSRGSGRTFQGRNPYGRCPKKPLWKRRLKKHPKKNLRRKRRKQKRKDETMNITAQLVNELRQRTGIGMMDCKKALTEAEGDIEKAINILRKKGLARAKDKMSREASDGVIGSYIHMNSKAGSFGGS